MTLINGLLTSILEGIFTRNNCESQNYVDPRNKPHHHSALLGEMVRDRGPEDDGQGDRGLTVGEEGFVVFDIFVVVEGAEVAFGV